MIGPKTKKVMAFDSSGVKASEHTGSGPPIKGVNCNFSSPEFDNSYGVRKLSISDA